MSPAAPPFRSPFAPKCVICQRPLTVAEKAVGKICSAPNCKNTFVREQALGELRHKDALRERAKSTEQRLIQSNCIPTDPQRVRAVLPSNGRPLVPLPDQQRNAFVEHLLSTIAKATESQHDVGTGEQDLADANPTDPEDELAAETQPDPSKTQLAMLNHGCALCRGHCCVQGHGHAFIQVETLLGFMKEHLHHRPQDILDAYTSHIGRVTYQDSCVYHGEQGCTLPREMRSKVCNTYLCKGLDDLIHQFDNGHSGEAFVIAVSDYERSQSDERREPSTRAAVIGSASVKHFPLPDDDASVPHRQQHTTVKSIEA